MQQLEYLDDIGHTTSCYSYGILYSNTAIHGVSMLPTLWCEGYIQITFIILPRRLTVKDSSHTNAGHLNSV